MIAETSSDPWSVRLLLIFVGAIISAVVGWLSSQVNHYRDSRKHHLEEIKCLTSAEMGVGADER